MPLARQGGDEGAARVSVGQFGAGELQVAKALQSDTGWQQNYFLGVRRSAGESPMMRGPPCAGTVAMKRLE